MMRTKVLHKSVISLILVPFEFFTSTAIDENEYLGTLPKLAGLLTDNRYQKHTT